MDSWAKAPDFEGDPVRSAAVREQTAADRRTYTEAGMHPVRCASCAVRVLVRKHSPQHTSVQWTSDVSACPIFAADAHRSLRDSCPHLAESITAVDGSK